MLPKNMGSYPRFLGIVPRSVNCPYCLRDKSESKVQTSTQTSSIRKAFSILVYLSVAINLSNALLENILLFSFVSLGLQKIGYTQQGK